MRIPYRIIDDVDYIFDEKNNTFLALRKVVWGDGDDDKAKLDMRRWGIDADGNEGPHKGFSFLTDDGPDELSRVLVEAGFGHTKELLDELSKREDFNESLNTIVGENSKMFDESAVTEDYYDPSEDEGMFDYEGDIAL